MTENLSQEFFLETLMGHTKPDSCPFVIDLMISRARWSLRPQTSNSLSREICHPSFLDCGSLLINVFYI